MIFKGAITECFSKKKSQAMMIKGAKTECFSKKKKVPNNDNQRSNS